MKHVRLTLDAGGREADIHPMYDVLANASYLTRATAMHWNFTGDELGIMHYVEGDAERFRADVESIPEVLEYELTPVDEGAFYVYIRDATNEPLRELLDTVTRGPVVVVPPLEYAVDGTVSFSVFGPSEEIQATVEHVSEVVPVEVRKVSGMSAVPGLSGTLLSERQREAVTAARSLGYYEVPRESTHEDVAEAIDCAPSTAAEHLRKAEAKVLGSILGD